MLNTRFSFISNDDPEFIREKFLAFGKFESDSLFRFKIVDYGGEEPIYEYTIDGIPTQFAFELATLVTVLKI